MADQAISGPQSGIDDTPVMMEHDLKTHDLCGRGSERLTLATVGA
jgi:hypothetical protein